MARFRGDLLVVDAVASASSASAASTDVLPSLLPSADSPMAPEGAELVASVTDSATSVVVALPASRVS